MAHPNLEIIEELRLFLESVAANPELRSLVTNGGAEFSRNRKLPLSRVVGLLLNMPRRSLSLEIEEFFEDLLQTDQCCTKGAFSLQRTKLKPLLFKVWNQWLVDNFYHLYADNVRRWQQFKILAIDGSMVYLHNTKEIREHLGIQTGRYRGIPMARAVQIHDVLNDLTLWADICPLKVSERSVAASQVWRLPVDSLAILDRGFAAYYLIYLMINQESPRHFVIRCPKDFNREVAQFCRSRKKSRIVAISANREAIKRLREYGFIITTNTIIKVRLVRFNLPGGEQEILMTNLYNEQIYTTSDLKYLYSLRWGIETAYCKEKNQLQMEQFSGHRVVCVEQDYAAMVFVANLQSLIEKGCSDEIDQMTRGRKYRYKVNRNLCWGWLKHRIVRLFLSPDPQHILLYLENLFKRYLEPVRPGRTYPRTRRPKRTDGKFQTFTNYKRTI
jgi:hypothetical protein